MNLPECVEHYMKSPLNLLSLTNAYWQIINSDIWQSEQRFYFKSIWDIAIFSATWKVMSLFVGRLELGGGQHDDQFAVSRFPKI